MSTNSVKETREFQAEVKQLLDIVINSLYTDREIFLRELISNASDALEKLRYKKISGEKIHDDSLATEIFIETDESSHTITITDTGIGMTADDLIENLGTIAHSGSKAFFKQLLEEKNSKEINLIGQFGVGFYSAFMVAEKVTLYTRSFMPEAKGYIWTSTGTGSYTIEETTGLKRGTKIVLHLKENAQEFEKAEVIKRIIKQYSSFVPFPIKLNGEKINTVQALWVKNKTEVSQEEYTEFYKFIANAYDEPLFTFHFTVDAPLNINALLFVPQNNLEKFGFGRLEPGVNLYCKKVLIQEQADSILPEWLRFVKGVIDSEELPLNISRETMQDSALIAKIRKVITGRFLKFLKEQSKKSPEKYKKFWDTFGMFIKEGAATDFDRKKELAELLRFQSSKTSPEELTSLEEYVDRMKENQKAIYYLTGINRSAIENGPYLEIFKEKDLEIIYAFEAVDDYVFNHLGEYKEKKFISADQDDIELPSVDGEKTNAEEPLEKEKLESLTKWLKEKLTDKVSEVRESKRLVESPAIILSPQGMTNNMRKMLKMINQDMQDIGPSILEINPAHPLIKKLNILKENNDPFAEIAAAQILDNALISAGILSDQSSMVDRVYKILDKALSV